MLVILGTQIFAGLLFSPADLALLLLGDILVDLRAHGLHDIAAFLHRVRLLCALGILEPVALGGILSPDLSAVTVLLPELFAHLLLLVCALFAVLGPILALFPEIDNLMMIDKFDTFQRPQVRQVLGKLTSATSDLRVFIVTLLLVFFDVLDLLNRLAVIYAI